MATTMNQRNVQTKSRTNVAADNLKLTTEPTPMSNASRSRKVRLATWDEIPEWQKDNEYILSGYVKETNSYLKTFQSLFYVHNETVNIYTHLIPGLIFLAVVLFSLSNYVIPVYSTTSTLDYGMFNFFFSGAFICLLSSSTFHCFKCHSEKVAVAGNKLDYLGIVALTTSSIVTISFYAFYDSKKAFYCFSSVIVSLGIACSVISLDNRFRKREWRATRARLFVCFGLSAFIPVIGGTIMYGLSELYVRIGLKWVLLEGVLYIFGAVLYGLRVPEKVSPGSMYIHDDANKSGFPHNLRLKEEEEKQFFTNSYYNYTILYYFCLLADNTTWYISI